MDTPEELAPETDEVQDHQAEVAESKDSGDVGADEGQTSQQTDEVAGKGDKPKTDKERLENTRRELNRKSQENADLKRKLDELSGKIEGVIQMAQTKSEEKEEANPFAFLDDEATLANLYEDPKNMSKVLKQIVGYIGQTLSARDKALLEEAKNLVRGVDPERRALAEKIVKLREDPENAIFSEDQLVTIAKKFIKDEKAPEKKVDEDDGYRGSFGVSGGGRRVVTQKDKAKEREIQALTKRLLGEEE